MRSLMLDADEVDPLLAYPEGATPPSGSAGAGATLDFGYFQLRSGPNLVGFPAVPAIRVMLGDVLGAATGGGDAGDIGLIKGDEQIAKFRNALRAALPECPLTDRPLGGAWDGWPSADGECPKKPPCRGGVLRRAG